MYYGAEPQISLNPCSVLKKKHISLLKVSDTLLSSQALMKDLSFSWPLMGILGVSEALISIPVFNSSYNFFRARIMKCLPHYSLPFWGEIKLKLHSFILSY